MDSIVVAESPVLIGCHAVHCEHSLPLLRAVAAKPSKFADPLHRAAIARDSRKEFVQTAPVVAEAAAVLQGLGFIDVVFDQGIPLEPAAASLGFGLGSGNLVDGEADAGDRIGVTR